MTPADVYRLARNAGLAHKRAVVATAVAWAESGLRPDAEGDAARAGEPTADGRHWGPSIGLWQVRSIEEERGSGGLRDPDALVDPKHNAWAMAALSDYGADFRAWSVWRSGAYKRHVPAVRAAVEGRETLKLVTRSEWGARPPKRALTPLSVEVATAHWNGPPIGVVPHERCSELVRGIQGYHQSQEYVDIAYNALVCRHGYVYEGRGQGMQCGANGTSEANRASYAVCALVGTGDELTPDLLAGMEDAARWLGATEWRGHREWTDTACPGDDLYAWAHGPHDQGDDDMSPQEKERLWAVLDLMNQKLDRLEGEVGGLRDQLRDHDVPKGRRK